MKNTLITLAVSAICVSAMADVKLYGPVGDKFLSCVKNHVEATDTTYLTDIFFDRTEPGAWQTEFWGKYMHSAVPMWQMTKREELGDNIKRGIKQVIKSQSEDGYIGNYSNSNRCGNGWDVWGMKYTMMGLLHYWDATHDDDTMKAAKKLGDFLCAEFGKGGKQKIHLTGNYAGMPSCSILEPVVWLYKRTKEQRYLDLATEIVRCCVEEPEGPRLVDMMLNGMKVAERPAAKREGYDSNNGAGFVKCNRLKAYEMMSCYQGLLEYYEITKRNDLLRAAIKAGESIIRDELNLAGGSCTYEHWFNGANKQTRLYAHLQETCVTTTWLRMCEKLLSLTHEPRWADEIEKTFYNAYLAAQRPDGREFASYTPLTGTRSHGQHHCRMHTNCCNANGPRGFLVFINSYLTKDADGVTMNYYTSSRANVDDIEFETYTLYPRTGDVTIFNRTHAEKEFTLRLHIPAWSAKTIVKVNNQVVSDVKPGTYCNIKRMWKPGDQILLNFDMTGRMHVQNHCVAFTRGPILLARDRRFDDGDVSEVLRLNAPKDGAPITFREERVTGDDMWMAFTAELPTGSHGENPEGRRNSSVHFCDYCSAGATWDYHSYYRTWFEYEWQRHE